MRWRAGAALVGSVLLVTGCSGPDLAPVPTVAAGPYACDGVPRTSAELITGESLEVTVANEHWGSPTQWFTCSLTGEHTLLQVEEMSVTVSPWGRTAQDTLLAWESASAGRPLDLDVPGAGYLWGSGDDLHAGWVCDERSVTVAATGDGVEGRDRAQDVTDLLVSMLPWACEGEDVPPADEEG